MRAPLLLSILVLSAHGPVEAQLDPRIRIGTRVRLEAAEPPSLVIGKVSSIEGDTLTVDRGGADAAMRFSLRNVTGLSLYRRGRGARTTGMVFGTLGALSGGVLYFRWCSRHAEECSRLEPEDDDPYDDEKPTSVFTTVSLGFGVIAYAIGYALVPPRWETVGIPFRVGVAPMQRGVVAYVSLPAPRFVR